jgi:tRNA A-37 threonylcarbamoyl transferase component Bud32
MTVEPYEILKLLGKGKGGYSYLADMSGTLVVVKKIHYEPCDYYQFESNKLNSELADYNVLRDVGVPIPELLSSDQEEQLLVKEYIEGDTLAEVAAAGRLTLDHVNQIFDMCGRLYPNGLNIDYFPTNFVERNGTLYYVDYECSRYSDEWNFENWGIYFLANTQGLKAFLQTGDHAVLLENGKPIRAGFEETVRQWIAQ